MAKTTIDIEALLHWAYGVQRVDRFAAQVARDMAGPSLSACCMTDIGELGIRVQMSGKWLTSMGAKIADDAVAVHDAVLALDDMFCEAAPNGDVRIWLRDEIPAAGMEVRDTRHGLALLRVSDHSGRLDWSNPIPVSKVVTSVLVIQHARIGGRPECFEDAKRPAGRQPAAGSVDAYGRKRATHDGPSWESVVSARAEYHVWHCALQALAAGLAPDLVSHLVLPPSAPASPWVRDRKSAKSATSRTKLKPKITM